MTLYVMLIVDMETLIGGSHTIGTVSVTDILHKISIFMFDISLIYLSSDLYNFLRIRFQFIILR